MQIDIDAVGQILAEVADLEIMPRFKKLQVDDIMMKGHNDPVTVADRAAEDALILRLTDLLPGSAVVGEESFAKDAAILSHFDRHDDIWVIDPIDGTRNFIKGIPEFAVMVALVRQKQTVAAWIHDPNSGDTLVAEHGSGVFLGGQKMTLAGRDPDIPRLATIGSRMRKVLTGPGSEAILKDLPTLSPGSAAAFDYASLFAGARNFAHRQSPRVSFLLYKHAKVWDHLAGVLMVGETGGYSADLTGEPFGMHSPLNGLFVAPSKVLWSQNLEAFRTVFQAVTVD